MGFTLPASVTGAAVRSYRTFSPLPGRNMTPNQAVLFSVALSVKLALSEPPRPLAGMLPYGDRTFLPPRRPFGRERATARPAGPSSFCQKQRAGGRSLSVINVQGEIPRHHRAVNRRSGGHVTQNKLLKKRCRRIQEE